MKRKSAASAAVFLLPALGIGWWLVTRDDPASSSPSSPGGPARKVSTRTSGESPGSEIVRRPRTRPDGTVEPGTGIHSAAMLKDFMMPEVLIEGLNLRSALAKLMETYRQICAESGEKPLELVFDLPPTGPGKLSARLKGKSFQSSIQMLAALSGMKVTRDKLTYRFEPFPDTGEPVKRTLEVPDDIGSKLQDQSAVAKSDQNDPFADNPPVPGILEQLKALGVTPDPSTRITAGPDGTLELETNSPADAAMITSLIRQVADEPDLRSQFSAKAVELPADVAWNHPDFAEMDDAAVQLLMREAAGIKGAILRVQPAINLGNGQRGTVEQNVRTLTYQTDDGLEDRDLGQSLELRNSALGFGQNVTFTYRDTDGGVDLETGRPLFTKLTKITSSGFSLDGSTRFRMTTLADGSRVMVMVTGSRVDAARRASGPCLLPH